MLQKAREIPQKTVICQSEVDANVNMLSRLYRGNLSRVSYKKEIFTRTRPSCDSKKLCKIKRNVTLNLCDVLMLHVACCYTHLLHKSQSLQ